MQVEHPIRYEENAHVSAAQRRIHRYRLLPHQQERWEQAAGALKARKLYDNMIAVPRQIDESIVQYTRRFVQVFSTERRRALLVNLNSELYDGKQRDNAHALALPHLNATIILGRVGLCRIVGATQGVAIVADALQTAGLPYVLA